MLAVPVSFFISLFLIIVLLRLIWARDKSFAILAKITLVLYAVQSVMIGLNWGYGLTFEWPVQGAMATLIPPLTWLALCDMVSDVKSKLRPLNMVVYGAPGLLVLGLSQVAPVGVDFVIVTVFVIYGGMLIGMALQKDMQWLERLPFHEIVPTNTAFIVAGSMLVVSACIDLGVSYDISRSGGVHASDIVGTANLVLLVILSLAIVTVGNRVPRKRPHGTGEGMPKPVAAPAETPQAVHNFNAAVIARLDELMLSTRIYRDENLSLERIARKMLTPSRQVSVAVNAQKAMSVPQYVNTFRILEACERLKKTDAPITDIIFEVGFLTKSNFNREFLRIVGMSPSAWRESKAYGAEPSQWSFRKAFMNGVSGLDPDFSLYDASPKI